MKTREIAVTAVHDATPLSGSGCTLGIAAAPTASSWPTASFVPLLQHRPTERSHFADCWSPAWRRAVSTSVSCLCDLTKSSHSVAVAELSAAVNR